MNKRQIHHYLKFIKKFDFWQFLALAIIFAVISVFALRQNNLHAVALRDNLLKVDQQNGDVNSALNKLRSYIYSHMNTDLASSTSVYPPIQLKYRYERLVAAEKSRVDEANMTIYTDAQHYCEGQNSVDFSGRNRVPCIQQYVSTHGLSPNPIPDDLYKFDFASPIWSPDLAGWSLFFAGFFGLLAIVRLALQIWLKHSLDEN